MDSSAAALRELKRKYDEGRNTRNQRQTIWLTTGLERLQRCIIDSANRGESEYSTYLDFKPDDECMRILFEKFDGCDIKINESEFNDNMWTLNLNWKVVEISEDEKEELDDLVEGECESKVKPDNEIITTITHEEYRVRLQNEMDKFYKSCKEISTNGSSSNKAVLGSCDEMMSGMYRSWKNMNKFSSNPPEWVKKIEGGIEGTYIPDRGYEWQQVKK